VERLRSQFHARDSSEIATIGCVPHGASLRPPRSVVRTGSPHNQ
jgi:hypothetical protein